jgi:hypothetical protein
MRTLRTAEDFTEAVLQAYREMVERAKALHGKPRLEHGPTWIPTDTGAVRRVSTVWFLPKNVGFRVEERGQATRAWEVAAWNHGGPVMSAEISFRRPPTREDIGNVIRWVGLLPPRVEVTTFGQTERQFLDGEVSARCGGWTAGWSEGNDADCGRNEHHGPHRY